MFDAFYIVFILTLFNFRTKSKNVDNSTDSGRLLFR